MSKEKNVIAGQMSLFDLMNEQQKRSSIKEQLFNICNSCWCYDCKHNSRNEAIPRDICGNQLPCPACEMCEKTKKPEICVIGSAKEGCSVRALEEGDIDVSM